MPPACCCRTCVVRKVCSSMLHFKAIVLCCKEVSSHWGLITLSWFDSLSQGVPVFRERLVRPSL